MRSSALVLTWLMSANSIRQRGGDIRKCVRSPCRINFTSSYGCFRRRWKPYPGAGAGLTFTYLAHSSAVRCSQPPPFQVGLTVLRPRFLSPSPAEPEPDDSADTPIFSEVCRDMPTNAETGNTPRQGANTLRILREISLFQPKAAQNPAHLTHRSPNLPQPWPRTWPNW